jgi:hypothetical protein
MTIFLPTFFFKPLLSHCPCCYCHSHLHMTIQHHCLTEPAQRLHTQELAEQMEMLEPPLVRTRKLDWTFATTNQPPQGLFCPAKRASISSTPINNLVAPASVSPPRRRHDPSRSRLVTQATTASLSSFRIRFAPATLNPVGANLYGCSLCKSPGRTQAWDPVRGMNRGWKIRDAPGCQ